MENLNGYSLIREWYNFKFENPSKCKSVHSDFYCYIIDLWNRLGQKKEFGLPTSITMECLGIGSYNTYKNTLNDLVDFGFIKIVSDAKNQYQSKVIAISKNDKANIKALDKANIKALDKASVKATDTIIEQRNKETNNSINYDQLLEFFNKITGRKHRTITEKAKKGFKKILEVGYTTKDIANAIRNCFNNEYHQKHRHFLTLDFISKMENFQKYVDSEPNKNNVVKLPEDYFKRFLSEEQKKLLTPLELSKWATEIKRKQMEGYTILPILN